jgi:AraC-like DNA-binding protein
MRSDGEPIIDLYVKTLFNYKYDALQKAGRTAEALAMSDRIRLLTDSIRQQERQADVEQLQEIKQQEEEIIRKHQSLVIHRIILAAVFFVSLLIAYMLWRSYKYNKVLTEKNHKLYEEIEQRRQEQQQKLEQLQEQPETSLTAEQQLYRRLCTLMDEQQPYTDENLNRETLASLLGTNEKYVVQAIRECSNGETVGDFINRYRLEHVARLLKSTDEPIAIVGELSGIPSRATLARLFRNAYGMTPTEYRKI